MFILPKLHCFTAVLIVMLFQVVAVVLLPSDGFWINDDAVKTIQIKTMAESKFGSFSIPLNGKSIDPDLLNAPIHAPFTVEHNGQIFPVWSFFFSTINALLFMLFGQVGLSIIPLLGSFLILLALIKIGELLSFTKLALWLSVFIVGLVSPVWFYSSVLWEHTIAVAFVLWSLLYCIRFMMSANVKFWIYSAVLLSLATYFREELYLWALLLVLIVIFNNRKERLIL